MTTFAFRRYEFYCRFEKTPFTPLATTLPPHLCQLSKFNLPLELLKQFHSAIIKSVLCTSITVWFSSTTKSDLRRLWKVVRTAERIIGTSLPTLQELYSSRVSKRAGKITLDPHIQHTPSLNCYRLVDATEFWVPERPDTETVSFCKQSISWTLDIKHGTHNTIIHYLFITHTYFVISNLHITSLYTHNSHFLCVFAFLYFVCLYIIIYYLYLVMLLSFCCTVELLSL